MLMQAEFCMGKLWEWDAHMYSIPMGILLAFLQYGNNVGFLHSMEKLWKKPTHRFPRGVADVYLPFFSYADDMR